jgi:putative DNA primase/helicase
MGREHFKPLLKKHYAEAMAKPEKKAQKAAADAAEGEKARKKMMEKAALDPTIITDPEQAKKAEDEAVIFRLARLSPLEYARINQKEEARKLGISKPAELDKLVKVARRRLAAAGGQQLQGREMTLREIEPWDQSVNGAEVLDQMVGVFSEYVAMPEGAVVVTVLWCAHTHVYELFNYTPRLNFTSPESECGKTTSIRLISAFVPRPMLSEVLTEATIFRTVEKYRPTILADEMNNWLTGKPEVLAVLDAGHGRDVCIPRCVGEDHEPRLFNLFAPAALCGIGPLPPQLHSRSIIIHLEKAKPGAVRADYDTEQMMAETEVLSRKLARFMTDNRMALKECQVVMPPEVGNRLRDNWRPLFKIAQVVGGDWPQRLNVAFSHLTAAGNEVESTGTRLLADIKEIFDSTPVVTLLFPSQTLVDLLNQMQDRGWSDYGRLQKGLTTYQLSQLLLPYKIKPQRTRDLRGYQVSDFKDAFDTYLPSPRQPDLPF